MNKVIGLTGGIATGKSTIKEMFKQNDIPVIDADVISHKLLDRNTKVYNMVIGEFGEEYILSTGHINRKKLGKLIFEDKISRKTLNHIMHPHIKEEMIKSIEKLKHENEIIILDIPLLFEAEFDDICDEVIVVYVTETEQLKRLMSRDDIDLELAKRKIKSQMPMIEKLTKADYKINNNGSVLNTKKEFKNVLEKIIK